MKKSTFITAIALVPLVQFLRTFSPSPLPQPQPPSATPPPEMEVFGLPTGLTYRAATVAYRGGSFFDRRDFSMAAVLVKHPRGDLIIDTGFGRQSSKFGKDRKAL